MQSRPGGQGAQARARAVAPARLRGAPLTRDAVIDTARRQLAERGLDGLSLRGVATRLGVTAPALYAHVADKVDLLRQLGDEGFGWLLQRIDPLPRVDAASRIHFVTRAYLEFARENPEQFRVMYLFRPAIEPAPDGAQPTMAYHVYEIGRKAVQGAIDAGLIESADPRATNLALWSAVHGLTLTVLAGTGFGREGDDRLLHDLVEALLRGLEPRS